MLDDRDPRRPRPNADGYGVTAPGRYPDLDAPFVSIVKETSKAPNPTAAAAAAAVPAAPAVPAVASPRTGQPALKWLQVVRAHPQRQPLPTLTPTPTVLRTRWRTRRAR